MKNSIKILAALMIVAALVVNYGCKDDDEPAPLDLTTITVNDADLNGATSPTGVPTDAVIIVTLSTNVDPATATAANIKLTRDYDDADTELDINTVANVITISPKAPLSSGNQYILTISEAVQSDKAQPFTAITRNFTTAGFFALPGQLAHWSFENNGDDEMGNLSAPDAGVDITYVDGRNAASGKAISFNGSTSIMEVPGASMLLDGPDFTVSFWVKGDPTNTHGNFVFGLAGAKGFQFEMDVALAWVKLAEQYDQGDGTTASDDNFWIGDGATKDNGGWQGWTFNKDIGGGDKVAEIFKEWTHVVCTFDGASKVAWMYVNGEKVKSHDFHFWPDGDPKQGIVGVAYAGKPAPADILAFGYIQAKDEANRSISDGYANYDDENTNHFKGQLDDLRFWKKAISADEVSKIYQSEK